MKLFVLLAPFCLVLGCSKKNQETVTLECNSNEEMVDRQCQPSVANIIQHPQTPSKEYCESIGKIYDKQNENQCKDIPLSDSEERKIVEKKKEERKKIAGSNEHLAEVRLGYLNENDNEDSSPLVPIVKILNIYGITLTPQKIQFKYLENNLDLSKFSIGHKNSKDSLEIKVQISYLYSNSIMCTITSGKSKSIEEKKNDTQSPPYILLSMRQFMQPKYFGTICEEVNKISEEG